MVWTEVILSIPIGKSGIETLAPKGIAAPIRKTNLAMQQPCSYRNGFQFSLCSCGVLALFFYAFFHRKINKQTMRMKKKN